MKQMLREHVPYLSDMAWQCVHVHLCSHRTQFNSRLWWIWYQLSFTWVVVKHGM